MKSIHGEVSASCSKQDLLMHLCSTIGLTRLASLGPKDHLGLVDMLEEKALLGEHSVKCS